VWAATSSAVITAGPAEIGIANGTTAGDAEQDNTAGNRERPDADADATENGPAQPEGGEHDDPNRHGRLKADALLLRPAATLGETQEQGEISQGIEQCHHGGDELDD